MRFGEENVATASAPVSRSARYESEGRPGSKPWTTSKCPCARASARFACTPTGTPSCDRREPGLAALFAASARAAAHATPIGKIDHIVVVYEENHSFDNRYGGWEGVNGRANAVTANTQQVDQNGNPYPCLPQLDVNIVALRGPC